MHPALLYFQLQPGNGELVLIVDDDTTARAEMSARLAEFGYNVVIAPDGVAAVEIFAARAREIYAVVSDLNRPFLERVSLVKLLQNMNPAVRILDLSDQSESELQAAA